MTSKPLGGFPKTITANLKIVNNLLSEFREKEGSILKPVRQEATQMLSICKGDAECEAAIKQAMKAVEDKWSNAHTKAINRKVFIPTIANFFISYSICCYKNIAIIYFSNFKIKLKYLEELK